MHKKIDDGFDELVSDLQHTLTYQTEAFGYDPGAEHPVGEHMTEALNAFLAMARRHGFLTRNIDNIVGYIDTSDDLSLPLYGLMCHLDVVPAGDRAKWIHPPYEGAAENGRIYGRGSLDDKGPAVVALHAMKAVRDSRNLTSRFRLIVGLDEETGAFRCMKRYLKTEEIPVYSFSPDGAFPLINAEKGIFRLTVETYFNETGKHDGKAIGGLSGGVRTNIIPDAATAVLKGEFSHHPAEGIVIDGEKIVSKGKAAHVKYPDKGDNAILKLLAYIASLGIDTPLGRYVRNLHTLFAGEYDGKSLQIASEDEISGSLFCSLSIIEADENQCVLKIDIRHPVTVKGDDIVAKLKNVFGVFGATVWVDSRNEPLYMPEHDPFVRLLLDSYASVTGEEGKPLYTAGGTYCRDMPNSVSFGIVFPGEEPVAHMANEYVNVKSLRKAAHIYAEALDRIDGLCRDK